MGDDLVAVASMESSEEAAMLREMLENANIPTVVRGALDPFFGRLAALGAQVLVRPEDFEKAREIYEAFFGSQVSAPASEDEPEEEPRSGSNE
ncbi:MAG: DUF2007 domain-containing protein [Acidobacteria bacterium]|nr:DUF2007 domain-containing protein [Acidobacteriota bacterium]